VRKLVAALACRINGSRLYGKPLQNLDIEKGISILDNIIGCLKQIQVIDSIVLGVANGVENDVFIEYAEANGVGYIRGDEDDVLDRLIQCGNFDSATDIFRSTSESPFPYFDLVDDAWLHHIDNMNDCTFLDDIIDGCGYEILSLNALKESHKKGEDRHRSELCTLYIRENKSQFNIEYISPPTQLIRKDIRLTVDFPEDLIVCRAVYDHFKEYAPNIPLLEVVNYLDSNPQLLRLTAPFCEEGYGAMYL
jgi:spore coat polysaccharide biosynthesis protein SpsF|tara:strand:+ start:708 stop:1457 length:750 start_codon:yes stop_codon:yes gene_type:complete